MYKSTLFTLKKSSSQQREKKNTYIHIYIDWNVITFWNWILFSLNVSGERERERKLRRETFFFSVIIAKIFVLMYDLKFDTHTTYDFRISVQHLLAPRRRNETNSNSEISFAFVVVPLSDETQDTWNLIRFRSFIKHAKERNKLFICINTIFFNKN